MKSYKANTLLEALEILASEPKAKIIAGGTDLIIELRDNNKDIDCLVDITSIDELKEVRKINDEYIIGGATPFSDILKYNFPKNMKGFVNALSQIGSPQIRNRGTIGGNIANASTTADSAPVLLALDARIGIESIRYKKEIMLSDFYNKSNNDLDNGIITYIKFKEPNVNSFISFEKLGYRKSLAISKLSISTNITINEKFEIEEVYVASGAIGKYPMREHEVEKMLLKRFLDKNTIELGIDTLREVISTRLAGRSSLEYKLSAIEYIFGRCLEESISYFKRCNND